MFLTANKIVIALRNVIGEYKIWAYHEIAINDIARQAEHTIFYELYLNNG